MSYLPCELHCHTIHSDGDFKVGELLKSAASDHLALIALTDHNTFSGHNELDDKILPSIRGIEWTTYFGHMLVLGAKEIVDWRDAVPDNIDKKIQQVKNAQGIVGVAHPYQLGSPICTGGRWEFNIKDWSLVDYIEVWHEDLANITSENLKAEKLWTQLLDKGYHLAASYGRDWHRIEKSGSYGCTYVDIEGDINQDNTLSAIRNGRTVISMGAKFFFRLHRHGNTYQIGETVKKGTYTFSFFTDLHSRAKDLSVEEIEYKTIKIISNAKTVVMETRYDQRHARLKLEKGKWYRAELWGMVNNESRAIAITSPIYCQ